MTDTGHARRTWFITGSSRGFGRVWTEAALERGDRVAATARDTTTLSALTSRYGEELLLPLTLDVTDKAGAETAVRAAFEHFDGLDVIVNNAGYGLFGAVEEVSEQEAREQIETNFFGALWVTQAALPLLRAQGSGHFLQVSSVGGVHAFPLLGLYHASKWALEGLSQSLAAEVRELGIRVTIVEPTGYETDWIGSSAVHATPIEAYDFMRGRPRLRVPRGDPAATAAAIFAVVDADDPPLRIFLGQGPFDLIREEYASRLAEWEAWDDAARAAHGKIASE